MQSERIFPLDSKDDNELDNVSSVVAVAGDT